MALSGLKLKLLKKKSLLAIVENSIRGGDNYLFRNLFAESDRGELLDVLKNGKNSCAVYVSWLLLFLELIKEGHATVAGTVEALLKSGWYEIDKLELGAIILWEKKVGVHDGLLHSHIGFYVGDNQAISNDSQGTGFPRKHHYTYDSTRKIERIYWHPELDNE